MGCLCKSASQLSDEYHRDESVSYMKPVGGEQPRPESKRLDPFDPLYCT